MKRYKVIYFEVDRSKPTYLIQLSKSGKRDGETISFWYNGKKDFQSKFKNDLRNGIDKNWQWNHPKNCYFTNWKKNKQQGIKIRFKR